MTNNSNLVNESVIYRVLHVIPYDGIGGVEIAAKSMGFMRQGRVVFSIMFIFQGIRNRKDVWRTFNLLRVISTARTISRSNVDAVVVSLWRSAIVGILVKLFNQKIKFITFLHCAQSKHFFDYFFNRLALSFSDAVWVDSRQTMLQRVPPSYQSKCRIISFVTRRLKASPEMLVRPAFIFWGRLTPQKDVAMAIRIFSGIHKKRPDAHFSIIGPDGGSLHELQALRTSLKIEDFVTFHGQLSQAEIAQHATTASFFLQTSVYEGMAMAVVESMQLGLVPVVTPVGEIAAYCVHGKNALIVESEEQAIVDCLNLIADNNCYRNFRINAVATWENSVLYRESVMAACEALV